MGYKVTQAQGTALTDLYTVPTGKEAVVSTLTVCNYGTASSEYDIKVRVGGTASSDIQYLAAGVALLPNDTSFITAGIALAADDVVSVSSTETDVTFMAFINERDA